MSRNFKCYEKRQQHIINFNWKSAISHELCFCLTFFTKAKYSASLCTYDWEPKFIKSCFNRSFFAMVFCFLGSFDKRGLHTHTSDLELQTAEQFPNERKNISPKSGRLAIFGVLLRECSPCLSKLPRKQKTIGKKAPLMQLLINLRLNPEG